ncbi:MAG: peptide deformylase [Vulcanimicrobiota bacterium]
MPVRPIVLYPDPILKKVCRPVEDFTDEVRRVLQDLEDTLEACPGVGVAAPQIGVDLRVIAVDVSPKEGHGRLILVNPELVSKQGSKIGREGCLSIPEFTANVARAETIVVRALDKNGAMRVFESTGFEAVCLQHEIDHLDGVLFLDRVVCLKSDVFRRKGAKPRFAVEQYQKG